MQPAVTVNPQGGVPAATVQTPAAGVIGLAALDALKGITATEHGVIDVTTPLFQRHTSVSGDDLVFSPVNAQTAYAIYRIEPPVGVLLSIDGSCDGPLWLMVADYGAGCWVFKQFSGGTAGIDLTALDHYFSPDGYIYAGVVSQPEDSGTLHTMQITYNVLAPWNLQLTATGEGITLAWDELDCDGYKIYRSTLQEDPAPYHVGTVAEGHTGENTFCELVPADGLHRWVPENNDNATPADTTDDFPTVAPAVEYYYRIQSVCNGHPGPESAEVTGLIPWGDRRAQVRQLPLTTDATHRFIAGIDWSGLTNAQIDWIAVHCVGSTAAPQSVADRLRALNPDFFILGSRYGFLPNDFQQSEITHYVYGEQTEDTDGDFPYIDRHEDWFVHEPVSTHLNQRVTLMNPPYPSYVAEIDSPWAEYLADTMLERLGEDCFDGWCLDYSHNRWMSDPPIGASQLGDLADYDYVLNLTRTLFGSVADTFGQHELAVPVFAEIMDGMSARSLGPPTFGMEQVALDFSDCDGVLMMDFLGSWDDPIQVAKLEEYYAPHILGWQAAGKVVILRDLMTTPSFEFTAYGCYLLLRGDRTYFDVQLGSGLTWSPAFTWEPGAPLNGQPAALDDLKVRSVDEGGNPIDAWYYRRDFANGSVIIKRPGEVAREDPAGGHVYEYLDFDFFCDVDAAGNVSGTAEWLPLTEDSAAGFALEGDRYCWFIREVE